MSHYQSPIRQAALAVVAGVAGGMISHRLDTSRTQAQNNQFAREVVLPDGGLFFKSKEGKLVAKLDADQSGGFLILYNSSERPAVYMGASQFGGGLVGVTTGKGAGSVLQLTGNEDGGSILLLTRGKRGVELFTSNDGGSLSINGPTGEPAVVVTTSENQKQVSGKIDIYESTAGKLLWNAPGKRP